MLSNLLAMLRNSFMALSSKQYYLDFFEDAHVPMPDISGYIRERVKLQSQRPKGDKWPQVASYKKRWEC